MDRVICSHEKLCGCVHDTKMRINKKSIAFGEPVVNPSMVRCAIGIKGFSGNTYCCLTRQIVHIIK
jgi:hypothetical protein